MSFVTIPATTIEFVEINKGENEFPLVWIPGMVDSAVQIIPTLKNSPIHTIVVSLRGRGNSSSPSKGFSFINHLNDIDAVVRHLELKAFYIYGHSVGAAYAAAYASLQYFKIKGLIMGDYLPVYPAFTAQWKKDILHLSNSALNPQILDEFLDNNEGFTLAHLLIKLRFPKLIIKAEKESLISEVQLSALIESLPNCEVTTLPGHTHDFLSNPSDDLVSAIKAFIEKSEKI